MERVGISHRASLEKENYYLPKDFSGSSKHEAEEAFASVAAEASVQAKAVETTPQHSKRRPLLVALGVVASALLLAMAVRKQLYFVEKSPPVKPSEVPTVEPAGSSDVLKEETREILKLPEQEPLEGAELPKVELAGPPGAPEQEPTKIPDELNEEPPGVLEEPGVDLAGPPSVSGEEFSKTELPELELAQPTDVPKGEPSEVPGLPEQEPTETSEVFSLVESPEVPEQEPVGTVGGPKEEPSDIPGVLKVELAESLDSLEEQPSEMPRVLEQELSESLEVSKEEELSGPPEVLEQGPTDTPDLPEEEHTKASEKPEIQDKIIKLIEWATHIPVPRRTILYRPDLEERKFGEVTSVDGVKYTFSAQFRVLTPAYDPEEMAALLSDEVPKLVDQCNPYKESVRRLSRNYGFYGVFGNVERGQIMVSFANYARLITKPLKGFQILGRNGILSMVQVLHAART
ncbi:hypothetical protein Emag_003333 [Eimeria magna]